MCASYGVKNNSDGVDTFDLVYWPKSAARVQLGRAASCAIHSGNYLRQRREALRASCALDSDHGP